MWYYGEKKLRLNTKNPPRYNEIHYVQVSTASVWRAMSGQARFYCTSPEIRWPVLLVARSRTRDFPLCSKVFNGLFYLSTGMPCRAFVPFKGASSCDVFLLTIVEELNCWKLRLNCWDFNFLSRNVWNMKDAKFLTGKIKILGFVIRCFL